MKIVLAAFITCLYVRSVVTHNIVRGLMSAPRIIPAAPRIIPAQIIMPLPPRRVISPFRPIPGVHHKIMLHKKYKKMLHMRASKMMHFMKKKKRFPKKPIVIPKHRFPAMKPLRPRPLIGGAVRGFGRRLRPMFPKRISKIMMQKPLPFPSKLRPPTQPRRPMPRHMGLRPYPKFGDDHFKGGDFKDRRGGLDKLDDRKDFGASFGSRFSQGFGTVGASTMPTRTVINFGRASIAGLSAPTSSGQRFGLGVASTGRTSEDIFSHANPRPFPVSTGGHIPAVTPQFPPRLPDFDDFDDFGDRVMDRMPDFDDERLRPSVPDFIDDALDDRKDFAENLRDDHKLGGHFPAVRDDDDQRRFVPEFDDGRMKPQVPEFVENVLDDRKDFTDDMRDGFKQGGSFPTVVQRQDDDRQFISVLDDRRESQFSDLSDDKSSRSVIDGFEMLGSRQQTRGSDIMNILKDNPFEDLGDPEILDQFSDDSDRKGDDGSAGTFAMLGIDPGTIQPFKAGDSGNGFAAGVQSHQNIPSQASSTGLPVDWAADFGFSVDQKVKKEPVSRAIPPPSAI